MRHVSLANKELAALGHGNHPVLASFARQQLCIAIYEDPGKMSDLSQNDATPKAHGSDPERKRNPSSTPSDPSMQPGLEVAPASGNDKQLISDADEGDKEVVSGEDSEAPHSDKKSYAPLAQSDW